MAKRLLLTGIGGSIGIHTFCHVMHNTDWHVVGIDSFRHKGLTDRVNEVLKDHPEWRERLTVVTHDLAAPFSPMTIERLGPIDYVISMASLSDVQASIDDPVPFVMNNVAIVLNTLELARAVKPDVFIQISTDEVWGPSTDDYRCKEWDPIVPSNPYSASKAAQECFCIGYWRTYGVPLIITNFMNNFAPMQSASKFPVMVQKMVEQGEVVPIHGSPEHIGSRYYLHSRNSADALIFLIRNVKPTMHQEGRIDRPDRFNVVGDEQLNNLELAQTIARLMGKELRWKFVGASDNRPGHDASYSLDGAKIAALGWTPPRTFEESMADTIRWQQEHPEWLRIK